MGTKKPDNPETIGPLFVDLSQFDGNTAFQSRLMETTVKSCSVAASSVTVGVACREDGASADAAPEAHWLLGSVVKECNRDSVAHMSLVHEAER
jgi:hypothetical protein